MMDILFSALKLGKICIVDVSQMRGTPALVLSGLILRKIFDYNQEEFTKAQPRTIPVIAVVEEAQAVLGSGGSSAEDAYVTWVKEGRKFDLGAVLVTQQPGSISSEILSQGDNWFAFHLLSATDLRAMRNANAHFSGDVLASLLNEPIPGHGVFWSSVSGRSYPIPVRTMLFEAEHAARDPEYGGSPGNTAAKALADKARSALVRLGEGASEASTVADGGMVGDGRVGVDGEEGPDALATYEKAVIEGFRGDVKLHERLRGRGRALAGDYGGPEDAPSHGR